MPTLGDVIEQVRHSLSGMDSRREAVAALRTAVSATDLTFQLDGPDEAVRGASSGVLEIGLELVRPRQASLADASVTLWPFGRGYRATQATEHPAGSEVRVNPQWPASGVAREVNGLLGEVYPLLYAVKEHDTVLSSTLPGVDVPADAVGVISVWVEHDPGEWRREDRWYFNQDSTSSGYPLRIGSNRDGSAVRVVYAAAPTLFDLSSPTVLSTPWSSTGLSDRLADLMALGVAKRLAPMLDASHLQGVTAAPTDGRREPGAGGSQARLLSALFQQRLDQEAQALAREHPIRIHRSR